MRKLDWSEVVDLVSKGERRNNAYKWELGDLLIRTIGRPSTVGGGNDGSYAKLEACNEELESRGLDYYATETLRNFYQISARYPLASRKSSLPWHVHLIAGNPEVLEMIIEGAPRNQKITQTYAASVMSALALARQAELDAEADRRRKAYEQAQREREKAEAEERKASSAAERKRWAEAAAEAARRQKKNQQPPKLKDLPPSKPKAEDMPILLLRAGLLRDLAQVKRSLRKLRETYEPSIRVLPQADRENGHEELMAIAEAARAFAGRFQSGSQPSHLSVVGEAS